MDFISQNIKVPCYIGETRYKSGIFLSKQIANRRKYAEHLRLIKFENYEQAKTAFLNMYGKVTGENIRLNCLYEVRSRQIYSVLSTPRSVGIFETELTGMFNQGLSLENEQRVMCQDNLTYDEAIKTAKEKFVKIYHNPQLYIRQNVPLNTWIKIEDVMKCNGI